MLPEERVLESEGMAEELAAVWYVECEKALWWSAGSSLPWRVNFAGPCDLRAVWADISEA